MKSPGYAISVVSPMQNTSVSSDNRLWNADYLKVLTTNFTASFAFYLVTPLLPIYLSETFSAPKDVIGLALSGYAVTAILSRPIAGWLVDSLPRKRVLLICIFLNFIFLKDQCAKPIIFQHTQKFS